ncbi:MAG: CYTH domain-containing protein [Eubacterium sp.]|nr:CYTH domain-containing protein [Eubacterium sp.]
MNEEKEIKILLNKEEYEKVNDLFEWSKDYIQITHYYGSDINIKSKNNTYRVREKNGKIKIQVKIPKSYDGSLHVKMEYEREISDIPEVLTKEELSNITGISILEDKMYIGKLVTRRKECIKYENVEICLDKNEYLNKTDYEIEIEFKGGYPWSIISILENNGIVTSSVVEGKNSRYLRELMSTLDN